MGRRDGLNGSAPGASRSQRQERGATVQSELEGALARLSKHGPRPTAYLCGRTDAGVHATGAVAHFDLARVDARLRP